MKRKISLLITLNLSLIGLSCSSAVPTPLRKAKLQNQNQEGRGSGNGSGGEGENEGEGEGENGGIGGGTKPPAIDPKTLVGNINKILAPENAECTNGAPHEPSLPQLRLLTKVEYQNTIKDLFGITKNHAANFPVEKRIQGFKNNAETNLISVEHQEAYMNAGKDIAEEIVATKLQELVGCAASAGESCAQTLIQNLGKRIWRRPITADESARMLQAFKINAASSPEKGLQVVLRILLSSPHFLYRSELGQTGKLTAYELAHALSYFFWSSVPDQELLKLADSGEILNEATLLKEAQRLMKSPKTKVGLTQLAESYLYHNRVMTITKDAQKFPRFTNEIRDAMVKEAEDTFDHLIRTKNASFEDLYASDTSVGPGHLANYYGAAPSNENGVETISFASQKRRGILSLGAVLSSLAGGQDPNPITRGVFVREHMLCEVLPFPTDIKIEPLPVTPGASLRERFAAHTASPSCRACHERIDGVGFGMDDYDAVGLLRDNDNGKPLDIAGNIFDLDGKNPTFSGLDGITNILKTSERAKRCFVLQAFRESQGRFEKGGDICAIRSIADDFVKNDRSVADMLIKIMTHPSLQKRKGN